MKIVDSAKSYIQKGFSPIPVARDSKKPARDWKEFQQRIPTESEADELFGSGVKIGIVCGAVSGNLEVIDFDQDGFYERWLESLPDTIKSRLVVFQTPSYGYHVWYRLDDPPPGNMKLAMHGGEIAIETRGEGGYVVSYPSAGYVPVRGKLTALPTLSDDERLVMLACAYALTDAESVKPVPTTAQRPGDSYNSRADWEEILTADGWEYLWTARDGNRHYKRPGKDRRETGGTLKDGVFYVFSSSAPVPAGAYTPFAYYAQKEFRGDFFMAAKELGKQGYGERKRREYDDDIIKSTNRVRTLTTFEDVVESTVDWLIEPYVPKGLLTMVVGDSGIGKSTSMYMLAAGLSNGKALNSPIVPTKTIILSAEDPADKVIRPRLREAGATLSMIAAPNEVDDEGQPDPMRLDESGILQLKEMIQDFGAGLVLIDPLRAYFDGDNMDNQLQARRFMRRLSDLAHVTQVAVIIVHHVNKNQHAKGRYRASGSQDFFDACRSVLFAAQDPNDDSHFALIHEKHNLSHKADAIGYTFDKNAEPAFRWTGKSDLTTDFVASENEKPVNPTKLEECKKWIIDTLERQGEVPALEIYKGAAQQEWNTRMVRRAKADIGNRIKSVKDRSVPDGGWLWRLDDFGGVYRGD